MSPDLVLILGCFGLSLSVTYLLHALFRPIFFAQRIHDIRSSLHETLVREGRWATSSDRAAYDEFSRFADDLIDSAHFFSTLSYVILRYTSPRNPSESGDAEEMKEMSRKSSPFRTMFETLAHGPVDGNVDPFRVAWGRVLIAMICQVINGPGSFLLATLYATRASFSSDPQYWLIGPLRNLLRQRVPGQTTTVTLQQS